MNLDKKVIIQKKQQKNIPNIKELYSGMALIPEEYPVGSPVVYFYRADDPACNDYSSASAVQELPQEDVVEVQEDPS